MPMASPSRGSGDEGGGRDPRSDDPLEPPADEERSDESASSGGESSVSESRADEGESTSSSGGGGAKDADEQELTAPSVGPHTVIERRPPEERLDFDKISNEDSMGRDKRRQVVGGTYGPTRARVLGTFAAFFAIVGAVAVGLYFLAQELDQPPKENPAVAPWSASDAPQKPPRELQ